MFIWIIDNDISFAHELKGLIKQSATYKNGQTASAKIEIFRDPVFLNETKINQREVLLIFLEAFVADQSGLKIFVSLKEQHSSLITKICFVSSMAYGRFTAFFQQREMAIPPFVTKKEIAKKIEVILQKYLIHSESNQKLQIELNHHIPYPFLRAKIQQLENLFKELELTYYSSTAEKAKYSVIKDQISCIKGLAEDLKIEVFQGKIEKLLSLLSQKRPVGTMRFRKELKDLMGLGQRISTLTPKK